MVNCCLQATLEGTKGKLTRALTYCGRLQKELKARRLEVRSLEVQLSKEPDKEKDLCALRTELVSLCVCVSVCVCVCVYLCVCVCVYIYMLVCVYV